MNKSKHTDLDGLIDLDSRSLIKLGNSAVVSIPSADDLGIIGNIDELDAAVSVRHWSVQGDRRPTRCGSMTNWHELTGFQREQIVTDAIQDQLDIQWSTNWSPLPTEAEQHVESAFEHLNAAKEIVEEDHE